MTTRLTTLFTALLALQGITMSLSTAAPAPSIKRRLKIKTLRVVGDPALRGTKVGMAPGAPGFDAHR